MEYGGPVKDTLSNTMSSPGEPPQFTVSCVSGLSTVSIYVSWSSVNVANIS